MTTLAEILKAKLPVVYHPASFENRSKVETYTTAGLLNVLKVIKQKEHKKEKKSG